MADLALPYVLPRIRDPDLEFGKYYNCLKSFLARRQRLVALSSLPIGLTVDMTTACQLRCPHCATGIGFINRRKLVMKRDVHDRIVAGAGDSCFVI